MNDKLIFEGEYLNGQKWNGKGNIYSTNNNLMYKEEYIKGQKIDKIINENEKITLFFINRESSPIGKIAIICSLNEKFSTVIQRYRSKTNDPSNIFVFRSKVLNRNLTIMEAGLLDHSEIYVIGSKLV